MRNRPFPQQKRTNAFRKNKKVKQYPLSILFGEYQDKGDPNTLERISNGRVCCDIDQKQLLNFKYLGLNENGFPIFKQIINKYLH